MAAAPAAEQTTPSATPTAAEFEAFDSFPWSKHKVFLLGLVETLGGPDALRPNPTHEGSVAFVRTVFFRRQTGRRVDLTRYNTFRAARPDYPSVDRRLLRALYVAAADAEEAEASEMAASAASTEPTSLEHGVENLSLRTASASASAHAPANPLAPPPATDRNRRIAEAVAAAALVKPFDGTPTPPISAADDPRSVPSWQRHAPRNALQVPRAALAPTGGAAAAGEAPYSDKFAQVVEAIQTGKPLEGIRQIPDTVIRQAGITPMGKLKAPRKPWETAASAAPSPLSFLGSPASDEPAKPARSLVDLEFPPPPEPTPDEADTGAEAEEAKPDATAAPPVEAEAGDGDGDNGVASSGPTGTGPTG